MRTPYFLSILLFLFPLLTIAQLQQTIPVVSHEMIFISDTQQPMAIEKLVLKPTHNLKATALLFKEIIKVKPETVFMLGDVVSLGFKNHRWRKVDLFLASLRKENVAVYGLLGNHDVMGRTNKGERNFKKRFSDNNRTGYVTVTDSVAVILLNSNFSKLSLEEKEKQLSWYQSTLKTMDSNQAILTIIVSCHHAPYTNSLIVKSSIQVQENFVTAFIKAKKTRLFITGHAHAFEHFNKMGKNFLVIGGGGGLHQPLAASNATTKDLAADYKPLFHYLSILRSKNQLAVSSHYLTEKLTGIEEGYSFTIHL